jgi:hypothetical protein
MDGTMNMKISPEMAKQSPFGDTMNMTVGGKITMDLLSVGKASDEQPAAKPAVKPAAKPTSKPAVKKPAAKKKG